MSNDYDYSDLNNYIMKKEIGEGNFGKVKLAEFKPTGEEFAIKILNKKKIKKQMKNVLLRENEIITKLNHINVVFVYKIIDTPEDYYIVMEYCKLGELFDYIVEKKKLEEEEASVFFYQLINGVEYIHSKGIAHRDLKPENLLLTEDKVLKIIDFGLSHEFNEEEFLKTKCGSPSYAAPEILAKPKYDGFKIDIWCCGIILYAMLCGYLPFEGDDENESNNYKLFKSILECEPEIPEFLSRISKDLILRILKPEPELRITINKIKKHPFYLKGKKLCKIDYSSCEKEIIKTRESFYNKNNEEKNVIENIKDLLIENSKDNINHNNNISVTEGNVKPSKNSIEILAKNNYNFNINDDNNRMPSSIDNLDKNTKAKIQLLSLKSKNVPKNEFNIFKKKFNPINLHNYNNKELEILNNKLNQILNTESNLPFIGYTESFFNSILSPKLKPNLENSYNIYNLNVKKVENENNIINLYKSPIKYEPQMPFTINRNTLENKINSCSRNRKPNYIKYYQDSNQLIFKNIRQKMENSPDNNSFNKNNILVNLRKNDNRIKEIFNINNNSKRNGVTNAINTFAQGNLALSLNNEKCFINKRKKINRYDNNYKYTPSHNQEKLIRDSYTEALNSTNNVNKKNVDLEQNSLIKKYSHENKMNYGSPEIKSIYNNIKINININSNTGDRKPLNTLNYNDKKYYNYNINIPNSVNSDKKLYMVTDTNIDNDQIFKNISISSKKDYINNSEIANKRNGISLPHNNNKNSKYNLTKIIHNAKKGTIKINQEDPNDTIKKNKSYIDNHSSLDEEDPKITNNIRRLKILNNNGMKTCDKRKNRDDALRYILFNGNKKINDLKDSLANSNNHILPKLNEHFNKNHNL